MHTWYFYKYCTLLTLTHFFGSALPPSITNGPSGPGGLGSEAEKHRGWPHVVATLHKVRGVCVLLVRSRIAHVQGSVEMCHVERTPPICLLAYLHRTATTFTSRKLRICNRNHGSASALHTGERFNQACVTFFLYFLQCELDQLLH